MITSVLFFTYGVKGAVLPLLTCTALLLIGICIVMIDPINRVSRRTAVRSIAAVVFGGAVADTMIYLYFFRGGEYINRGVVGGWARVLIYTGAVLLSCISVYLKNKVSSKRTATEENNHG